MSKSFSEAVAERSGCDVKSVDFALARNGIIPDPFPPRARPLTVERIYFAGTKNIAGVKEPFEFDWTTSGSGLWGLASESNLVGKTSILQIALWALRGTPKSLTAVVRSWLSRVEVTFTADGRKVDVRFDVLDGIPSGEVLVAGEPTSQIFSGDASFRRIMQDVMLRLLGLDVIQSSQQRAGSDEVVGVEHGWLTYTGAFLSDTESDAILGQNIPNTNIAQMLLQIFLGLPWATTLFQARAANRVVESERAQRKKRLSALGGRTVEQMEAELSEVVRQIENEAARSDALSELSETQHAFDTVQQRIIALRQRITELEELLTTTKEARVRAERVVLDIKEENRASVFFKQLDPHECPRCSTAITDARRSVEVSEHRCSVCTTPIDEPDATLVAVELSEAEKRVTEYVANERDVERALSDVRSRLQQLLAERAGIADRLEQLSKLGTAMDVQVLGRRKERLEGMLDVARSVIGIADDEADYGTIVSTAAQIAENRAVEAAQEILDRVSEEITRIVKRLGMRDVERVTLDRAAHVRVYEGGTVATWGSLAKGQQLRLRIATVVALARTARQYGVGRHPGLLLIDSPGSEEMEELNLTDLLEEIATVTNEVGELQVFVAMRGVAQLAAAIPKERIRFAGPNQYLW